MLFNFVDGADVGMVQRGSRLCLTLEALQRGGIGQQLFRQKLQRHLPAQLEIFGLIDQPHTTGADDLHHAVVGNLLAQQTWLRLQANRGSTDPADTSPDESSVLTRSAATISR